MKLHCQINRSFSGIPQILCWTECLVKFCISILVIALRLVDLYGKYFKELFSKKKENVLVSVMLLSFLFFRLQWPVRSFLKKFHSDWHVCLSMLWRLARWSFHRNHLWIILAARTIVLCFAIAQPLLSSFYWRWSINRYHTYLRVDFV